MMVKQTAILAMFIFSLVFGASSCRLASGGASGESGTVRISLTAGSSSRAVTASVDALVASYTVTLTDVAGTVHTASATGTASIGEVYPGAFTVSVVTYGSSGAANGSGTGSGTVGEGGSASVSIGVSIEKSGTGSLSLPITFPTTIGITSVSAVFLDSAASSVAVSTAYTASASDGKATLSAASVPSGTHYLAVSFYENAALLGTVVEAVNIWDGVTSSLWLKADGSTATTRDFTANEIATATAKLYALTVAGKSIDLSTGTEFDLTGSSASDYITDEAIVFVPLGATEGQTITYTWNGTAGDSSVASGDSSPDLPVGGTDGVNTLVITVTSLGGTQSTTYTVTFTRAFPVVFSTAYGTAPDTQTVLYGGTVSAPTSDPSMTGFIFDGWYADSVFTTAWVFDAAGTKVTTKTTLYANWITAGAITAYLTEPQYLGIYFKLFWNVITATTMDKDGTFTLSLPTGGTSWQWYLDSATISGATSRSFAFNPSGNSITAGIHTVSVYAVYNGVGYSGNLSVTVVNDAMVTVIPSGMTATYCMIKMDGAAITSTMYDKISPYEIAKTETTYALWSAVYNWAIAHGYSFANLGSGTGSNYPVVSISLADMMAWCNAYTEMTMGVTEPTTCCYTASDGSVLRDSTDALTTGKTAVFDRTKTGYRLPTEGEWQYAASGREQVSYNQVSGCVGTNYSDYAIYAASLATCATKQPNALGLYDMSGNAEETCADRYDSASDVSLSVYTAASPAVDYCNVGSANSTMVYRGGSYGCSVSGVSVGYREYIGIDTSKGSMTFRLARTIQ